MSTPDAINAIRQVLAHAVALPESKQYVELSQSYFTELEREIQPACFVTPSSTEEVVQVIKAIKPLLGPGTLTICGSGQQATPLVSNVPGGLTVHLRNLKGIQIDTERSVVSVAAGEKMGDVYEKLMAVGLATVGHRHSSGGVGGDAIQGGLSYFSYDRGFVCDNVVNYEIVLANGDIVDANAETNRDLWVALKGGANNFGIVTRFDLRVFPQGPMWGGKVFYFEHSFPGQIRSLVDYLHSPEPDVHVHICLSIGYTATMGALIAMNDIFCTRPEQEVPAALAPFAEVNPQIDTMRTLRVESLKGLTDEGFSGAVANRVVKMTTTLKANTTILEYAVQVFKNVLEELKGVENLLFSITFEPIPVSLLESSKSQGGNSLGLDPAGGPLVVVLLYTSWDRSDDDNKVFETSQEVLELINTKAREDSVFSPYVYMNYAFPPQDPISSYGPESKAHLLAVSRKFDPEAFFQIQSVGPWKLQT